MRVLITGGTGSVGAELVKRFSLDKKYKVTFTYHSNKIRALELADACNCQAITIDEIEDNYDIIINCAGVVNSLAPIEDIDVNKWEETMHVNLYFPFIVIKKNLPYMRSQKWGRIINIASIYGVCAEEDVAPYSVSKHGLIGLTKSVAKEYAKYGITCNAVCPATIVSEMCDRIAAFYTKTPKEREDYFRMLCEAVPAKRLVYPNEVAEFVYFLCGENAGYINGATLMIDGGYTA